MRGSWEKLPSVVRFIAYFLTAIAFIFLCSQPFAPIWATWLIPVGIAIGAGYCAARWGYSRAKLVAAFACFVLGSALFVAWLHVDQSPGSQFALSPSTTFRSEGGDILIDHFTGAQPGWWTTQFMTHSNVFVDHYIECDSGWVQATPNAPGSAFIGGTWMIVRWRTRIRLPVVTVAEILALSAIAWALTLVVMMIVRRKRPTPPPTNATVESAHR